MTDRGDGRPEEEGIRARVSEGLDEAKEFAKTLDFEQVRSGEWFVGLLQKVVQAYDRNARAGYFRRKYPGLPPDDVADVLISVTARYASVAGGLAGAATTSAQASAIGTAGMTAPLFVGAIGSEMIYLARLQLRLVLDLSVIYDLQLDPEDPEDVLMVFGYAVGIAPTELLGKAATTAAGEATGVLVKRYVSNNVLKALQGFARKLGFKILQRTILKFAVPVASAAVGGGYNYVSTRTIGRIAKSHFKHRRKSNAELRTLVSRKNAYDIAFAAAALHVSNLDGEPSLDERDLYRAMLSRMSFADHAPDEFQALVDDEEKLMDAITGIEDREVRCSLVSALVLMAVCDGKLSSEERRFLTRVARTLEVPLDLQEAERRSLNYRTVATEGLLTRTASGVRYGAVTAGGKVGNRLGRIFGRRPFPSLAPAVCSECAREIPPGRHSCPDHKSPASEQGVTP